MSFSFAIDIATKHHNLLPLSFLPRLHFSLQSYFTGKLQFHMWHFTSDVRLIWLALYMWQTPKPRHKNNDDAAWPRWMKLGSEQKSSI